MSAPKKIYSYFSLLSVGESLNIKGNIIWLKAKVAYFLMKSGSKMIGWLVASQKRNKKLLPIRFPEKKTKKFILFLGNSKNNIICPKCQGLF